MLLSLGELTLRHLEGISILIWTLFLGLLEWIIPKSWYAKSVEQDIVLITGAGSGLGRSIALEYAALNSSLILWDINDKGLEETKAMVETEHEKRRIIALKAQNVTEAAERKICLTYVVDVSDRAKIYEAAEQVNCDLNADRNIDEPEKYVSVLVNNAGIYYGLTLQQLKDEQIEKIFKINILAHFWTVRAFLPKMMEHERGHIVEIASMGGIAGLFKQVDYCATKFATVGFEESLSMELDLLGYANKINTTVVCPLFFSSNLFTGYDNSVAALMTPEFVAKEAVMAMRCNHSRVLLPKLRAYSLWTIRTYLPRKAQIHLTRFLGFGESIKNIKGKAQSDA